MLSDTELKARADSVCTLLGGLPDSLPGGQRNLHLASARDVGGAAPAFMYRLVEGMGQDWAGALRCLRDTVLTQTISARNAHEPWTGEFKSLGASPEDVAWSLWSHASGIRRICLVTECDAEPEDVQEQPISEGFEELLPHIRESLISKQGGRTECAVRYYTICNKDGKRDDGKGLRSVFGSGTGENLIQDLCLLEFGQASPEEKIRLAIWSCAWLGDGGTDGMSLFLDRIDMASCALRKVCHTTKNSDDGGLGEVYFSMVFDTNAEDDRLVDPGVQRHLFGWVCARVRQSTGPGTTTRVLPNTMRPNALFRGGVFGLEGGVVVCEQSGKEKARISAGLGTDGFFGGGVWAAWIITIFQRLAIERLARASKKLGEDFIQTSVQDQTNITIASYWHAVIDLEAKWMYREIARTTDLDRVYREYQEVFDIESMWEDVREQTEFIARYTESERSKAESERLKTVNDWQTMGGFGFGALILLAGIFGMNLDLYDKPGWPTIVVTVGLVSFPTLCVMFSWWLKTSSTDFVRRMRQGGKIGIIMGTFIFASTLLVLSLEMFVLWLMDRKSFCGIFQYWEGLPYGCGSYLLF